MCVDLDHQLWRNNFRVVPYIRHPGAHASFDAQDPHIPGHHDAASADLGLHTQHRWAGVPTRTRYQFGKSVRNLGADELDMSVLPAERRFLATVGRRLTVQALERRDP